MRRERARGRLEALARAHGVAVDYTDARGRPVEVPADTVGDVLGAMGVACHDDEAVAHALAAAEEAPWRRALPPTVVTVRDRPGTAQVWVRAPEGARLRAHLEQSDGGTRPLAPGPAADGRRVGGRDLVARPLTLPADLPLGYHWLVATVDDGQEREERAFVVAAPAQCPVPLGADRAWGWMVQLYALRSRASWGLGDIADLGALASWSGRDLGADFVVCNPLHAVTPVLPLEPSPYYPSSRRFANPLYLRVEDTPEFAEANPAVRRRVERLAAEARTANRRDRIDRDAAWRAKLAALELLRGVPSDRDRRAALADFRARGGAALEGFATFCALAERHGRPWQRWPEKLRHPRHPAVAAARAELAGRVAFHQWLQFCLAQQLASAQRHAEASGMGIGVVHDLAVGVDPGGVDAWALQDDLALGVTVGAPPDPFNQQGQDWRQPPLRPDRLRATGYAAFRDMLSGVLAHAGGVRIDHVPGLFRLWWIPEGRAPHDGTYVTYPAGDLLAILACEAARAGAVVVGEDLGTVEPRVRAALAEAGVLGSSVLYFERTPRGGPEGDRRLRSGEYPEEVLASATTHDLPTVAGWWADEDVRVQADLGLLGADTTAAAEHARKATEREEMMALLRAEGLLGEDPSPEELSAALHAFLARTSARLVAVQPADAVGDRRQPNVPGTTDEYPNWRLPVAEATPEGPRPILLEEFMDRPGVRGLARAMAEGRALARRRRPDAGRDPGGDASDPLGEP